MCLGREITKTNENSTAEKVKSWNKELENESISTLDQYKVEILKWKMRG